VNAANLNIDDSIEGEITLRHDANFEGGVDSNGTIFDPYIAGSVVAPGENAAFSGTWIVNSAGNPDPGSGIIYIVDPDDPTVVSDTIFADWGTPDLASITVTVESSACGDDLGSLPSVFDGLGVAEPDGSLGIQGLFRDPDDATLVSIPSNLTIQFVSVNDTDCDGIPDAEDFCPGTFIPESVPTVRLGKNRWALTDDDGIFDTAAPNGKGPKRSYTIEDTGGCSCEQIIDELGLGKGHSKFGCSISAMDEWTATLSE
jgi:hypothetical protein